MARLKGNTSNDLIRRYHAIHHRLTQHHHPYDQDHIVLVAQMNEAEVTMLEGELKEIKIKMSLMGIAEPMLKNNLLHGLASEYVYVKPT